jgi:hypothetical protein
MQCIWITDSTLAPLLAALAMLLHVAYVGLFLVISLELLLMQHWEETAMIDLQIISLRTTEQLVAVKTIPVCF